jgi:hypothetical protein
MRRIMRMRSTNGEEAVLRYKHKTKKKKTHSARLLILPRPPLSYRLV